VKLLNVLVALMAIIAIFGCSKKSEKMTDEEAADNLKKAMQYEINPDKLQRALLAGLLGIRNDGLPVVAFAKSKFQCYQGGARKGEDYIGGHWEIPESKGNRFDLSITDNVYSTDKYGNGTLKVVHPNWEEQNLGSPEDVNEYTFNVSFSKPLDSLGASCSVTYLKPEVNHKNFDEHLGDQSSVEVYCNVMGSLPFVQDKLNENDKTVDPAKVWTCSRYN
jgi:hypothetical protein